MVKYDNKAAAAALLQQNYISHIDTIQTKELTSNRKFEDMAPTKGVSSYSKDGTIVTKYNPNNCGSYYKVNKSLDETKNNIDAMMAALTVINPENVNYSRVDIATDVCIPFNYISKVLELIHRCISLATNYNGNCKKVISMNNDELESYIFKSNMMEIEFYDKYKQAVNKSISLKYPSKYPTRLEIRFLRRKTKDLKLHIKKAIQLWKTVPERFEEAEEKIISFLKCLYEDELRVKNISNFEEFVCRYQEQIFTRHILEELYKVSNMKDTFKNWLSRYRKKHTITFYTKTEVKTFSKDVIKSLKNYMKK